MSMFRRRLMMYQALNNKNTISYPGLVAAWSAKGKTNEDEDRDVLRDLTGNGHDILLKNFAFAGMSGYGGFNLPIDKYVINGTFYGPTRQYGYNLDAGKTLPKLKFNVNNLSENTSFFIRIIGLDYNYIINKNGYWETDTITNNTDSKKVFEIVATGYEYNNVEIEFLPEYPNALVFDGVDDYGVNKDMPYFPDGYTLIIKRKRIKELSPNCLLIKGVEANQTILAFENTFQRQSYETSYGSTNHGVIKEFSKNDIVYRTPNSYNGITLTKGVYTETGNYNKIICLGNRYDSRYTNFAFYSAYLFDRSLSEQEIKSFIRKHIDPSYLLPGEAEQARQK